MPKEFLNKELKNVNGGSRTDSHKYDCGFTFTIPDGDDVADCMIVDYLGNLEYQIQIKRKTMNAPFYQKMHEQVIDYALTGDAPKAFF